MHDEDDIPLLTWQDVPRRERIVLLAVMIALLTLSIGFYVWIASVPAW